MPKVIHSDYQIRWKNYKRFEDTGWLTIKPLTILIGPNSSGKSSILSPLLLLRQTIASSDTQTPLVTRGELVDVGNYTNFVHRHETSRDVFFGLRYHIHEANKGKELSPVGDYAPGALEVTFDAGAKREQARLKKFKLCDIYGRSYLERNRTQNGYDLKGVVLPEEMTDEERHAVNTAKPVKFLFGANSAIRILEPQDKQDKPTKRSKWSDNFEHYLRATGYSFAEINETLRELSYVGPVRQRAERYYRIAAASPATVGVQGENAPHLFRLANAAVKREIDKWISGFELGSSLASKDIGADLFELCLEEDSQSINMADAGFGASQVFPLIVQALVAPKDSLTLAEQPEIHLNPRLQSKLADLFVQMANTGHRVLIETHSEHLLVRLRTLIASGEIPTESVALYFVEKEGSHSVVRQVPIASDGGIANDAWPAGFFDDGLRGALAFATARSQANKKAN